MSLTNKDKKTNIFLLIAFGLIVCAIYGIAAGIRTNVGIILNPMAEQCGLDYSDVSICIAVMQIVFGASQPLFGIIASRRSNRFVMLMGIGFLGASMVGIILARNFLFLMLSLGLLFGLGGGALAFGLILTSATYFVGRENAMMIAGMLNAASGMFSFFFAPIMQKLLDIGGLRLTLMTFIVIFVALIPCSLITTSRDPKREKISSDAPKVKEPLPFREAFRNRTYLLLLAGFSTCGFHMVIIESHLFSQFVNYGIPKASASWAFSVYGIATIVGALLSGYLSTKINKAKLLSFYYGFRTVWTIIYLVLMPKNLFTAIIFAIGLGFTGDATVSPTSGLVNENFNLKQAATLIGLLFLVHQVGAFLSAWLGGLFFSIFDSYTPIWLMDMCLCTFASIMSFLITVKKK